MLTFLNSAILFGLAAVSIPILIHLFTRQKNKTIVFSSLKFLKELQRQKIRKLKIRQILLLILRALLILLLVLAFARPTLKSKNVSSLKTSAQLTAVIILDNTLSMGFESNGRLLLEKAKVRAAEVASLMRQGDEIYLLLPQSVPKFAFEDARFSPESVQQIIMDTPLSFQSTDYSAALIAANELLSKSQNINKEIYLIGDLQKNGFRTSEAVASQVLDEEQDIKLFLLPVTNDRVENLSITEIVIGDQILEKGKVAEIQATIRNTSEQKISNRLVHFFVNGKRQAQDVLNLEANASTSMIFRMVPGQTGFQSGYILLEEDKLMADNKGYFGFNIPDQIPILLVGNKPEDTQYINLALNPGKNAGTFIKANRIDASQLSDTDLSNYRVIIFSNISGFSSTETVKIQNYVKLGGGVFFMLGDDVDLRNYNDNLHKKLKLPVFTQTISQQGKDSFLTLGKIDYKHPVFKGVFGEEKAVESPHVRFAVDIQTDVPVEQIIEYSNGSPFLFEAKLQAGRIFYLTTSLANDWSDLIYRGLFVPLLNRSVMYLSGAASNENEQLLVGREIEFASEKITASASMIMEKPDGNKVNLKPEIVRGNYFVRFTETDLPGIYKLFSNDALLSQWAVNYNPDELNFEEIDREELKSLLPDKQIIEIMDDQDIAATLQETRFGREFWKTILFVALVFFVAETVLLKEKIQKKSD